MSSQRLWESQKEHEVFLRSADGAVLPDRHNQNGDYQKTPSATVLMICANTQLVEETYCSHSALAMFLFLLCPKLEHYEL